MEIGKRSRDPSKNTKQSLISAKAEERHVPLTHAQSNSETV